MKVKDLMTLPEYRAIDYLSVFRINPKTYKINYCSKGQPDCVCVGDYKRESFDYDNPVMPKETFKAKVGMSKEEVENMEVYDVCGSGIWEDGYIEIFVV